MFELGQSVVAIFKSRQDVIEAVDYLSEVELVDIGRTAVVARSKNGETVLLNHHVAPDEAGLMGGALGALIVVAWMTQLSVLALPGMAAVVTFAIGALIGGLVGRQVGRSIANPVAFSAKHPQIEDVAECLEHGEVALIVEVDSLEAGDQLRSQLELLEAKILGPLAVP
jgi:uncharacterized membrane protein